MVIDPVVLLGIFMEILSFFNAIKVLKFWDLLENINIVSSARTFRCLKLDLSVAIVY